MSIARYPSLDGATVIITGGGSGIGAQMVRRFAEQGSRVGFLDIADEPSRALVAEIGGPDIRYERCDVTDVDALRAAIGAIAEAFGPATVLVNNAAHDERHAWQDVTSEVWDRRLELNLKHQFFASQAVAPGMIEAGHGSIINMGSVSWMIGNGGMAGYTASKSAVLGLTRSLARDLGPHNIRVNSVAPGWIMTERQKELWLDDAAYEQINRQQCLKRLLVPDDIARPVLFFASDEAGACTNQSYIVDGGWV